MKIIHLIPNLKNGGAENVLVNIALKIREQKIRQAIFTLENADQDFNFKKVQNKIEVFNLKNSSTKIKELIDTNPKAIVICWLYKTFIYYEKIALIHNFKNKYYWNIRHSDFGIFQLKQKFLLLLLGIYSNFSGCGLVYCSERSRIIHERYFFKRKNSIVIPNRLAKSPPKKINNPKEKNFILFIGRKHPQKNPKFLKKIFKHIELNYSNVSLVILGRGWTKQFFQTKSNKLIIYNQKENIFDYLSYTSCLLFTSKFGEGYPNVIAEAMAVGTTILGFDSGDYSLMTKNYELAKTVSNEKEFLTELNHFINLENINHSLNKIIESINKELDFELTIKQYLSLI